MKALVIAEKPSVAMALASVLGARTRKDGYVEGNGYIVSWCVGHLVGLCDASEYDEKYKKWRYDDLPIVPECWKHKVLEGTKKQFGILKKLMRDSKVDEVICATDLEQREGRIIRQGNHNKKVHIFRYVTESTFDSYMWQLIENKQKFISQIMTSKAPVRSCEDVDEAALSYAEVKALATGNPAVKEKMALDVDVAKLKLLKANHMNNQYRLEDDIARNFPQQIAKLTETIDSYKADIAHYQEHKITDPEQFSMEISGKVFTEKKEAGAALLAVCKDMKAVDAAMDIGNYQGFNMRIQFDSWSKEFILSVKHESVSKVHLGADALGNITRINNLLESYPEKLAEAEQRLETVQEQLTNAKEEVGKPFTKEEELNQKLERLSELNALLNMDEREDTEAEQSESKEKEERPARGSIHEKLQIYKEKSQRESENGREDRKRDFGLE